MDETTRWRAFVEAYASVHGLQVECLEDYNEAVANGEDPRPAAWCALFEWDCLPAELILHPDRMEAEPDVAPQAIAARSEVRP